MQIQRHSRWFLPAGIFVATCFSVFILPLLLPPPFLQGISEANIAGFNNKVAYMAAAILALIVFILALRKPWIEPQQREWSAGRLLSPYVQLITTLTIGALLAVLTALLVYSDFRYDTDAHYFLHQISMHADYGRALYDEIEFPYGPLLFYPPIWLHTLLSPFHVSAAGAYFTTLVLYQMAGMVLIGWMLNNLPIRHRWRTLLYFVFAVHAVQFCFGLNYTHLRFCAAPALLIFTARQQRPWRFTGALFAGQLISLAISPEMGIAFFGAGLALAIWHLVRDGRSYLPAVAAPIIAAPVFVLTVGTGYVRMLGLFARGVLNFPVEPMPYVLLFLFAFIWLVPPVLALGLRRHLPEAPMMAALYVFCTALLPVAFGRCDPGHVILNEISLFMLSFVAIGWYSQRTQKIWAGLVALILLYGAFLNVRLFSRHYQAVLHNCVFSSEDNLAARVLKRVVPVKYNDALKREKSNPPTMSIEELQRVIGKSPVATPRPISLALERALRASGQYTPSSYYFDMAVLDRRAEIRQVDELNHSQWMIRRLDQVRYVRASSEGDAWVLGAYIPYPEHYPGYIVGKIFEDNLEKNWESYAIVEDFQIYRRK